MKMAIISLAIIILVTAISVIGYINVSSVCSEVEDFARKIDESTELESANKAAKKWDKDKKLLSAFVPAQSLNSVTAAFSLLSRSLEAEDSGGIAEAKAQLSVCAKAVKEAESVTFANIF